MDIPRPALAPHRGPGCPFARWTARLARAWQRLPRPRRRPSAADHALSRLGAWRRRPDPSDFPYDAVVGALRHTGKHFAPRQLLASLADVRAALPPPQAATSQLARFLATALDKWDDRYDNPSYLGLDALGLACGAPAPSAARRDHLVTLLVADALRFELAAADGTTALQPELRPPPRTTEKRCRHALLVFAPVLARRGAPLDADVDDPVAAARRVVDRVFGDATPHDERLLQLTLLPVSRVHDECLFIRVLQSYEATFAHAAGELAAAATALGGRDAAAAVAALDAAARVVGEASPLFSLIGTLQPQAFLDFRRFTDGASAIQSRNYKLVESACRTPDPERVDSPAYRSVPEVREAVLAGRATIDGALLAARLDAAPAADVRAAMGRFAGALLKWRRTHLGVAGRMLGGRRGTGDTDGQAYLARGLEIPVFAPAAAGGCPLGHGRPPRVADASPAPASLI